MIWKPLFILVMVLAMIEVVYAASYCSVRQPGSSINYTFSCGDLGQCGYVKYQFGNNNFNGSGDFSGGNLMPYLTLNNDIGSGALRWGELYVQNISAENINAYNITADYLIGDCSLCTNLPSTAGNPFDQNLNTTDNVMFNTVDINSIYINNSANISVNDTAPGDIIPFEVRSYSDGTQSYTNAGLRFGIFDVNTLSPGFGKFPIITAFSDSYLGNDNLVMPRNIVLLDLANAGAGLSVVSGSGSLSISTEYDYDGLGNNRWSLSPNIYTAGDMDVGGNLGFGGDLNLGHIANINFNGGSHITEAWDGGDYDIVTYSRLGDDYYYKLSVGGFQVRSSVSTYFDTVNAPVTPDTAIWNFRSYSDILGTVAPASMLIETNGIKIGDGYADTDYHIKFIGENGVGNITWMEDENRFDISNDVIFDGKILPEALYRGIFGWTDFMFAATQAGIPFWQSSAAIQTGTFATGTENANHPGVVTVTSSATANSGYTMRTSFTAFLIAGGETSNFIFRVPVTANVTAYLGFMDSITAAAPTDGCWINIANATLSGKCKNNAGPTTTGTIYNITAATWYRGNILINSDATSATFTLYNNATSGIIWTDTVNANIPTAAGRETGHGFTVTESAGTTQNILDLDYMDYYINRVLNR